MHTRLSIYNAALGALGQSPLHTLNSSDRDRLQAQVAMDNVWESSKRFCLEQAFWNFAQKTEEFKADLTATPAPGYQYVIFKPHNWYRTMWLKLSINSTEEIDYLDEGQVWFTNFEAVIVRYLDGEAIQDEYIPAWSETFVNVVAQWMAHQTAITLTQSDTRKKQCADDFKMFLRMAKTMDVFNQPNQRRLPGSWVGSRLSYRHGEGL